MSCQHEFAPRPAEVSVSALPSPGRSVVQMCVKCGAPVRTARDSGIVASPVRTEPEAPTSVDMALLDIPPGGMDRDAIVAALEAEVTRRNEWYGLDNWDFGEVVDFVLDRAAPRGA